MGSPSATRRLTLDYGVRLVHQQPQYDKMLQASNFLPERWDQSAAPLLYLAGCAKLPCTGNNRQAMDPRTGKLLGPNTTLAIGTIIPGTGNQTNGLFLSGQGIAKTTHTWPALAVAPRFGMAYDVTGDQKLILRGGFGLFFDRTSGNAIYNQVQNPPTYTLSTLRYASLQQMSSGLATVAAPALNVYQYKSDLPSTWSWNGGVQMILPWSTALDVEYTGQYAFNVVEGVGVNNIDLGAAFLPFSAVTRMSPAEVSRGGPGREGGGIRICAHGLLAPGLPLVEASTLLCFGSGCLVGVEAIHGSQNACRSLPPRPGAGDSGSEVQGTKRFLPVARFMETAEAFA